MSQITPVRERKVIMHKLSVDPRFCWIMGKVEKDEKMLRSQFTIRGLNRELIIMCINTYIN